MKGRCAVVCFVRENVCFWANFSVKINHLQKYGPGTRFGVVPARIDCDVCVSHLSFRFSSVLECRSASTVVFPAVPIEAGLVLHSSLIVFHGQVSSGSAGYLPSVRLTDQTSACQQHHRMHWAHHPWEKFPRSCSCVRARGLFHHQFFETEEG